MSKNISYLLSLMFTLGLTNNENPYNVNDIIKDEEVSDCLFPLYISMMCNDEIKQEEYYNKFEDLYNKLSEEQKEVAKVDIAKILKIEYKPKVKKKER